MGEVVQQSVGVRQEFQPELSGLEDPAEPSRLSVASDNHDGSLPSAPQLRHGGGGLSDVARLDGRGEIGDATRVNRIDLQPDSILGTYKARGEPLARIAAQQLSSLGEGHVRIDGVEQKKGAVIMVTLSTARRLRTIPHHRQGHDRRSGSFPQACLEPLVLTHDHERHRGAVGRRHIHCWKARIAAQTARLGRTPLL